MLRAVGEHYHKFTILDGSQFQYAFGLHNSGAVYAKKLCRIEFLFERSYRLAHQKRTTVVALQTGFPVTIQDKGAPNSLYCTPASSCLFITVRICPIRPTSTSRLSILKPPPEPPAPASWIVTRKPYTRPFSESPTQENHRDSCFQ